MSAEAIFGNIFAANPIVVKRVMSLRCQPQQHSGKDDQDGFSSWWSNRTAKSIIKVLAKLKLLEDFDVAVNLKSTSKCIALSR
ncbi:hypothetical protein GJ496_007555 [Pomphorhynchus laevis]|nr:hypothetical protein GJ496_007555 [Pomphorhynchus laevis]